METIAVDSATQNLDASGNPARRCSSRLRKPLPDVSVAGDSSRRKSARLSGGDTLLGISPGLPPPRHKKRGCRQPRRSIASGLNPSPSPGANPSSVEVTVTDPSGSGGRITGLPAPEMPLASGLNPNPTPSANPSSGVGVGVSGTVPSDSGGQSTGLPNGEMPLALRLNRSPGLYSSSGVGVGVTGAVPSDSGGQTAGLADPMPFVWPIGSGKNFLNYYTAHGAEPLTWIKISYHQVLVEKGEDILSKLKNFMLHRHPRFLYILWAKGAVSNATIRTSSVDFVTLEGCSQIVSLEGYCSFPKGLDAPCRTLLVSAHIAGADGLVVGGCPQGELVAASPVEVTMYGFWGPADIQAGMPDPLSCVAPIPPASALFQ